MKLATPSSSQLAAAVVIGVLVLLLPVVFPVEHHFPWDGIPGFYGIFGVVGCGLLIIVTRWLGRVLLVKPADWWGEERGPDEDPA